jgi:hypothetical protein
MHSKDYRPPGTLGKIEPGILKPKTIDRIHRGEGDPLTNMSVMCSVGEKTGKNYMYKSLSFLEMWTAQTLTECGFLFVYEPMEVKVPNGHTTDEPKYLPDFLVKKRIDEKEYIVFESHGKKYFTVDGIKKYAQFYEQNKKRIHFVIITDMTEKELDSLKKHAGIPNADIADKVIHVPPLSGAVPTREEKEEFIAIFKEYLDYLQAKMTQQFWLSSAREDRDRMRF